MRVISNSKFQVRARVCLYVRTLYSVQLRPDARLNFLKKNRTRTTPSGSPSTLLAVVRVSSRQPARFRLTKFLGKRRWRWLEKSRLGNAVSYRSSRRCPSAGSSAKRLVRSVGCHRGVCDACLCGRCAASCSSSDETKRRLT